MSFGYSIGDFVTLASIALNVVQNTRKACGAHADFTREVNSLHVVLNRLQLEISKADSILNSEKDNRKDELAELGQNCQRVLRVLSQILEKYNALSEEKRSVTKLWQQVQFGNGEMLDLGKIRSEVTMYTQAITLFLNMLAIGSQGKVEKFMDTQGDDMRDLKRSLNWITARMQASESHGERSILTSYSQDDKLVWKEFRRELVKEGFSSRSLGRHKKVIKRYILELSERGLLDETIHDEGEHTPVEISIKESDITQPRTPDMEPQPFASDPSILDQKVREERIVNNAAARSEEDELADAPKEVEEEELEEALEEAKEEAKGEDDDHGQEGEISDVRALSSTQASSSSKTLVRHDSGISASSSSHGKHRKNRTPEEPVGYSAESRSSLFQRLLGLKGMSVVKSSFMVDEQPHYKEEKLRNFSEEKRPIIERPRFSFDGERPKVLEKRDTVRVERMERPGLSLEQTIEERGTSTTREKKHKSRQDRHRDENEIENDKHRVEEEREARKARKEADKQMEIARAAVAEEARKQREKDEEDRRTRREARRRTREENLENLEKMSEQSDSLKGRDRDSERPRERERLHRHRHRHEKEREREEKQKSEGAFSSLWSAAKKAFD